MQVPYKHDLNPFIPLLKRDATYCRVGVGKVVDSNEIGQMNLCARVNRKSTRAAWPKESPKP